MTLKEVGDWKCEMCGRLNKYWVSVCSCMNMSEKHPTYGVRDDTEHGINYKEIKSPNWYTWIPEIECKHVTVHFPWAIGSAIKYLWRVGRKGDPIKDLQKAKECIDIQIEKYRGEMLTDNDKASFLERRDL